MLYQSDALVLASRSEVQPLVLLEAMSTGIPVIGTECTPQNQRIAGGCTVVPIDDVEALAAAMQHVAQERNTDGKAISDAVKRMASPKVVGQQLVNLFNGIIVW